MKPRIRPARPARHRLGSNPVLRTHRAKYAHCSRTGISCPAWNRVSPRRLTTCSQRAVHGCGQDSPADFSRARRPDGLPSTIHVTDSLPARRDGARRRRRRMEGVPASSAPPRPAVRSTRTAQALEGGAGDTRRKRPGEPRRIGLRQTFQAGPFRHVVVGAVDVLALVFQWDGVGPGMGRARQLRALFHDRPQARLRASTVLVTLCGPAVDIGLFVACPLQSESWGSMLPGSRSFLPRCGSQWVVGVSGRDVRTHGHATSGSERRFSGVREGRGGESAGRSRRSA